MSDEFLPASSRVEVALFRRLCAAEGRYDAFSFATRCRGDPVCLRAELQEKERLTAEAVSAKPRGPMTPGASPRIYRDACVAGLREAIEIVVELGEPGSEPPPAG